MKLISNREYDRLYKDFDSLTKKYNELVLVMDKSKLEYDRLVSGIEQAFADASEWENKYNKLKQSKPKDEFANRNVLEIKAKLNGFVSELKGQHDALYIQLKSGYTNLFSEISSNNRELSSTILSQQNKFLKSIKDLRLEDIDNDKLSQKNKVNKELTVYDLKFSRRLIGALSRINSDLLIVNNLLKIREGDFIKFRNFGKKSVAEMKDKLENAGYRLGQNFKS